MDYIFRMNLIKFYEKLSKTSRRPFCHYFATENELNKDYEFAVFRKFNMHNMLGFIHSK